MTALSSGLAPPQLKGGVSRKEGINKAVDTIRVDICYRPLRIGWAIRAGDIEAFRKAVRLSYTMWGGRFNPIIVVDREEEACRLVDVFRVDVIIPVGNTDEVKNFPKRFPYLISPFFPDALIIGGEKEQKKSQVLDVHNALVHLRDKPEWKHINNGRVCIFNWQPDDPLADVFLIQLGGYPSANEIGIDYRDMLIRITDATEFPISSVSPIRPEILSNLSIAYISRHGLKRHYGTRGGWDIPGFFVGDVADVDDLVCYWNLRAADIPLLFVDTNHFDRYAEIIPAWDSNARKNLPDHREWFRDPAVWSRCENIDEACRPFGDMKLVRCRVSIELWNGLNVFPPMMYLGKVSTLGVVGSEQGKPKISFPLVDKPFCGDVWFHTQSLVASVSFLGGLYGDEHYTLIPPYIPERNESCARTMHFIYNKLRIEPKRVGLVIDAADVDTFLYALPVADLVEWIFGMAGFATKLSAGGLIARQLIAQLGGLQGARAFKIPGVRRLVKEHGPREWFTKNKAKQMIESKDLEDSGAKFNKDHQKLYIEPRTRGTPLT